jgi:hypothetical protein
VFRVVVGVGNTFVREAVIMNTYEWGILIATAVSAVVALAPWMMMVHAKLAVIAARLDELHEQMVRGAADKQELWQCCSRHGMRLQTHEVQIAHLAERVQDLQ